ncbi:MAG: response regulator [Oligoflexia bacterium]|nr:response regulator [Oligoflexia bacterium]
MNKKIKSENSVIKILMLDDERSTIDAVIGSFDDEKMFIYGTTDPFDALEKIKSNEYDLFVTDYLMKPINGDEVIERIRKFDDMIYIILLTGHAEIVSPKETFKRLDIQYYCEKGKFDTLSMCVESACRVISAQKKLENISEKLKHIISFIPTMYRVQNPLEILKIILPEISYLFGIKDTFLLIDDVININYGNKYLYYGLGKFNVTLEVFSHQFSDFFQNIEKDNYQKMFAEKEHGHVFHIKNKFIKKVGILYLENKGFKYNEELMNIFITLIESALENIFLYILYIEKE